MPSPAFEGSQASSEASSEASYGIRNSSALDRLAASSLLLVSKLALLAIKGFGKNLHLYYMQVVLVCKLPTWVVHIQRINDCATPTTYLDVPAVTNTVFTGCLKPDLYATG